MKNVNIEEVETVLHAAYLAYVKEIESLELPDVVDTLLEDECFTIYLMTDGSTQLVEKEV